MSAGTRSSAITAAAPACSAIFACVASTTSMMTPPLSISASPTFTRKLSFAFIVLPSRFRPLAIGHCVSYDRNRPNTRLRGDGVDRLRENLHSRIHLSLIHSGHGEAKVGAVLPARVEFVARGDADAPRGRRIRNSAAGDPGRQMKPEQRVSDLSAPPGDFRKMGLERADGGDPPQLDLQGPLMPGPAIRAFAQEFHHGSLERQRSLEIRRLL